MKKINIEDIEKRFREKNNLDFDLDIDTYGNKEDFAIEIIKTNTKITFEIIKELIEELNKD